MVKSLLEILVENNKISEEEIAEYYKKHILKKTKLSSGQEDVSNIQQPNDSLKSSNSNTENTNENETSNTKNAQKKSKIIGKII